MNERLESMFREEMLSIYRTAKYKCNYNATRFLQMIDEQGGLGTAKTLLHSHGYSDGFTALWECKCLDISMEALVLKEPWSQLFTDGELAVARERLHELGYKTEDNEDSPPQRQRGIVR